MIRKAHHKTHEIHGEVRVKWAGDIATLQVCCPYCDKWHDLASRRYDASTQLDRAQWEQGFMADCGAMS